MDFKKYKEQAMRTMNKEATRDQLILNAALGLAGEAGEVADHVKKVYMQGHPLSEVKLVDECGDVLWYLALMCEALGIDMTLIAQHNVEKLRKRYPQGFDSERSVNRNE